MINLDVLDKNKTYCIYEVGTGMVSTLIQKVSLKDNLKSIPTNRIATHIAVLIFCKDSNDWTVFESHAKTDGVHKESFESWIAGEVVAKNVFCYPFYFNKNMLEYYVEYNPGYSLADIARFYYDNMVSAKPETIFNDNPGVVCSEYAAKCNIDKYCGQQESSCISDIYSIPAFQIKPIHFQMLDPEEQYLA